MRGSVVAAMLGLTTAAAARDGATIMSGADLARLRTDYVARAKASPTGTASTTLTRGPAHAMNLVVRVKTDEAEEHRDWADELVLREGRIDLVLGGTIDGRHEAAPGEYKGSGITGGTIYHLKPGDVAEIPAGMPHWQKIVAGPVVSIVYKVK